MAATFLTVGLCTPPRFFKAPFAEHTVYEGRDKLAWGPVCKRDKEKRSFRLELVVRCTCSSTLVNSSVCCSLFCGFRSRADRRRLQTVVLVHNMLSSIFIFSYTNHGSRWSIKYTKIQTWIFKWIYEQTYKLKWDAICSIFELKRQQSRKLAFSN